MDTANTYTAELVLCISEFSAENKEDAERILNEYIDTLGDIAPMNLTWPELDYTITEWEGGLE